MVRLLAQVHFSKRYIGGEKVYGPAAARWRGLAHGVAIEKLVRVDRC